MSDCDHEFIARHMNGDMTCLECHKTFTPLEMDQHDEIKALLAKVKRLEALLIAWTNEENAIPDIENPRSRRYVKELKAALEWETDDE